MSKLRTVYLTANECISEVFSDSTRISEMSAIITHKCGFNEIEEIDYDLMDDSKTFEEILTKILVGQNKQVELQEIFMNKTSTENKICHHNLAIKTTNVAVLEAKLAVTKELCDKLEIQYNKTCSAQNAELYSTVDMKMQEITELSLELLKMRAEINEKNQKIERLEEKLEIMSNNEH